MSAATEAAERDAALAEAETEHEPDEAEAEELAEQERAAEVEPEPEPEPSSQAVIEGQEKALAAEQKRHANALAKALGEHWGEFELCPLCQVDGYAMAYGPGEIGPEQRQAILTVMGEAPGQNLGEHPTEVRCSVCDGYGEMLNGSRRPEQMTSACQTCMGTGHIAKPMEAQPNGHQLYTPPPPPYVPPFDPSAVNHDKWGRDPGNLRYGQDPATNGGLW